MILLRSAAFNVLMFVWTILLYLAYMPVLAFPPPAIIACARFWAFSLFTLHRTILGLSFEFRGSLPEGGFIVASAHQSAWEVFGFHAVFRDPVYVLKKELTRIPLFALFVRRLGMIAIDRSGSPASTRAMLRAVPAALAAGRPVVVFPGGTRSPPGVEFELLAGIGALYRFCGVPVVPVSLNTGFYWGRRSFIKKPGVMIVEFGEPIPPGLRREEFMTLLAERIASGNARLLAAAREDAAGGKA